LIAEDEPLKRDPLTERHIKAYSVGHFNNDLCASMWFIYLSYYLINVVKLTPNIAATAILSG
jgi:Na+/melibiose symporter-like transporter